MTTDYVSKASDICNRIYHCRPHQISVDGGNPPWFDQASSKIALIAGDDEIPYIDHNIGETVEGVGTIVAFTDDVVIVIEINAPVTRKEAPTRVISRKDLRTLEVDTVSNAIGYTGRTYPERIGAVLGYANGDTFALPYKHADQTLSAEFAALLPSLATDVRSH